MCMTIYIVLAVVNFNCRTALMKVGVGTKHIYDHYIEWEVALECNIEAGLRNISISKSFHQISYCCHSEFNARQNVIYCCHNRSSMSERYAIN